MYALSLASLHALNIRCCSNDRRIMVWALNLWMLFADRFVPDIFVRRSHINSLLMDIAPANISAILLNHLNRHRLHNTRIAWHT
jgi:hypothetical protein